MSELDYAERTLHTTVEQLSATERIGPDDERYFHDRIDLLLAELRHCQDPTPR